MKETLLVPGGKVNIETTFAFIPDVVTPTNQPPVVNAGANQSIQLPVSTATLKGEASDIDGSIVSSVWVKLTGPAVVIAEPNNLQTAISGLQAGNYVFRLTVTDDKGASVSKDTTLVVNAAPSTGTPVSFTPTQITTDFVRPGAGAEQWHGAWDVDIFPGTKGPDKYYRFQSWEFEKSKGVYDFSSFDTQMSEALGRRGKFSFGIMTCFNGGDYNRRVNYPDGSFSSYPAYLHAEFQSSSQKDTNVAGCWVAPWNNPIYHDYLLRIHQAINAHLDTTVINGVRLCDAIKYIDIRGFGNYGEWHTSGIEAAPVATGASLKKIVDTHLQGFPNHQLIAMIAALDGGSTGWAVFPAPADVSHYILTAKNSVGEIGWRRDSLGSDESYIKQILENNNKTYNGVSLKSLIMNKWKAAPIHGERYGGTSMAVLPAQVKLYHMAGFGNGDFIRPVSSADSTAVKEANKNAGYWMTILNGSVSADRKTITINWSNTQTPPYENYEVYFEVRNGSTITTLPKSKFNPRLFTGASSVIDTFDNVPSGSLHVAIKDPNGYRKPLPLAMSGRQADGSYFLANIN